MTATTQKHSTVLQRAREVKVAQQQRNHRALGCCSDECRYRRGCALVNIRRPQMKWHDAELEADAGHCEHDSGQQQGGFGSAE